MNRIRNIILLVSVFLTNVSITFAQRLESKGDLDLGSISTEMKAGQSSARVIVQSALKLNYKSNMGDLTSNDIRRGNKNQLNVDTLYFYIADGDNKRRLTISVDGYPDEVLTFNFTAKQTYNYIVFDPALVNSSQQEQDAGGQYLVMRFSPSDVELIIDNESPQSITGGAKNIFLSYGEHQYTVSSRLYKSKSGVVNIGAERTNLEVDLIPNFGYIDINTTPSGASVEINDMVVGTTPYKSDKLLLGEYAVRISTPNFAPITQVVSLTEGAKRVSLNKSLNSYLSKITITCSMSDANILINEEKRGIGSWSGELLPATYEIKSVRDGHKPRVMALVVEKNTLQTINIDAPTPMYGKLNIDTQQTGVMVAIDGKQVGEAPNIFSNVLAGKREITFSKDGYNSLEQKVTVNEGQILNINIPQLTESNKIKTDLNNNNIKNKVFGKDEYKAMGCPVDLTIPEGYTSISSGITHTDTGKAPYRTKDGGKVISSYTISYTGLFNNTKSIVIPNTVTYIGVGAFAHSKGLTVYIPNSVTSIGKYIFRYSQNVTVYISKTSPIYEDIKKMKVKVKNY